MKKLLWLLVFSTEAVKKEVPKKATEPLVLTTSAADSLIAWKPMPTPQTPKEVADAIKKLNPKIFVDGKLALMNPSSVVVATFYEDGRIELTKGYTLEQVIWLLLWTVAMR